MNPYTIAITYQNSWPNEGLLGIVIFDSMNYCIQSSKINISMDVLSLSPTSMDVKFMSNTANQVQSLTFRYYLAYSQYADTPIFSSYEASSKVNRNVTSSTPYTYTYTNLQNTVSMVGVQTFYAITGLDI